MVINRLAIGGLVLAYLLTEALLGYPSSHRPLLLAALYVGAGGLILADLLRRPGISRLRRSLALALDIGTLSAVMGLGGRVTSLLYPFYLWIIFGNGFRFGLPWLRAATVVSLVGFGLVLLASPFWQAERLLGSGLVAGLVVLPLYAGTLIQKLNAARQEAEAANRAKSLFLASVSHELRTPLTAVIGLSDLLTDTALDAEQREMVTTVRHSAATLFELISDILNLSSIEAGKLTAAVEEFDLHELLSEVRRMMLTAAAAKGLALSLHITPRTPRRIRADRRALKETLTNLLGNAVKFTERGYVSLAADAAPAKSEAETTLLRVEVADSGIGVAPDAKERIFETFTQADETIINRFGGTGLGLAIARRLIELAGGAIGVESESGRGSLFWFTLPCVALESALPAVAGATVFLLAPVPERAERLRAALGTLGIQVLTFANAAQAIARLQTAASSERRRILLIDEQGLEIDPAAVASLVPQLGPLDSLATVLVAATSTDGLPPPPLRRHIVAVLGPKPTAGELAAALAVAGAERAEAVAATPVTSVGGRSLSVLLAENNRINQKVITRILERGGHRVKVVENGEAALDALEEGGIEVVMMDVNMPVMTGIEATRLYRFAALGEERRVPIIALTADATEEGRRRCLEAGMDACLTKPVEPARLLETISALAPQAVPKPAEAVVRRISEHPRFLPGVPALDPLALENLTALGGDEFVAGVVKDFFAETAESTQGLRRALEAGDWRSFGEIAHALCSAAANVGARGLQELCQPWQRIGRVELEEHGEAYVAGLNLELDRVKAAIRELDRGKPKPQALA